MAESVDRSAEFYCDFLGFAESRSESFTGEGKSLVSDQADLLVLPARDCVTPNPVHFAFETDQDRFVALYQQAQELGLQPRKQPPADAESGIGLVRKATGEAYDVFYVFDPSGVNVELMSAKQ